MSSARPLRLGRPTPGCAYLPGMAAGAGGVTVATEGAQVADLVPAALGPGLDVVDIAGGFPASTQALWSRSRTLWRSLAQPGAIPPGVPRPASPARVVPRAAAVELGQPRAPRLSARFGRRPGHGSSLAPTALDR